MCLFIIDLLVFIAVSFIHLWRRRYHGREMLGHVTKMFLIPSLYLLLPLSSYAFGYTIYKGWMVFLIAVFYSFGDLFLLLKKRTILFYLGALSFSIGHVLYMAYFSSFHFSLLGLFFGLVFAAYFFTRYIRKIHKAAPGKEAPYIVYGISIALLVITVYSSVSVEYFLAGVAAIIGSVFFGYSDSRIAYNKAGVKRTTTFSIMLTYIIANIFLLGSVILLNFGD